MDPKNSPNTTTEPATPAKPKLHVVPPQTQKPTATPAGNPTAQAQPTTPQDPQAAILAELRALRSSIDANRVATETGFRQLIDELEEVEPGDSTLTTPAATPKDDPGNGASRTSDSVMGESSKNQTQTESRALAGIDQDKAGESDHAGIDKQEHRKRPGESRSDWIVRLRTLPPVGQARRRMHESREVYQARRFDGTKSKD